MLLRRVLRTLALLSVATLSALLEPLATPLAAQKVTVVVPEFTKQGLLIVNFGVGRGADMKLVRRATDGVRSRVAKLANKREVEVIDRGEIDDRRDRAGYEVDTTLSRVEIRELGKFLRVDEYVWASVSNSPKGPTISGELVLMRDEKLRQVLPDATAPTVDSAAALFARSISSARTQLIPERRCESAMHDGRAPGALAAAREGISMYARAVIARTCMVWTQQQMHGAADDLLKTAKEMLAIDSTNSYGLEAAAIALDSLHRQKEAGDHWLRLAATDTANLELILRVSYALSFGGNSIRAEPLIVAAAAAHPEEIRLVQQKWRVSYDNKSWTHAIEAAEDLLQRDTLALRDSTFYLKLGTAYRANDQPYKAIETLAHAVGKFHGDSRLYSLYAQYIKTEADTVIPRGLALFPNSADLFALNARDLRTRGKLEESLVATKAAVALDSSMRQGHLMVAQLELQLRRPDSALAALRAGLSTGEDSTLVAQFALAEGSGMYRTANSTKVFADFNIAFAFLSFADSVRSSPQSRYLADASALAVVQGMLQAQAKLTDVAEQCKSLRASAALIVASRANLQNSGETFAESAKAPLGYLDQLETYNTKALATGCASGT